MQGRPQRRGGGSDLPQREARAERQLRTYRNKLGAAKTPAQRVGAASDFARSVLSSVPDSLADPEADRLVRLLEEAGVRLQVTNARRNTRGSSLRLRRAG